MIFFHSRSLKSHCFFIHYHMRSVNKAEAGGKWWSNFSGGISKPVEKSGTFTDISEYCSSNYEKLFVFHHHQNNNVLSKMYGGRYDLVVSCTTSAAMGLFGVGVIGMQVRQVAGKPQECFVNSQLCIWVHFTLRSVALCEAASKPFLCHAFKRTLCSAHVREDKFRCFVYYCFCWFPSWLMAPFPDDRIRPQWAKHCSLW